MKLKNKIRKQKSEKLIKTFFVIFQNLFVPVEWVDEKKQKKFLREHNSKVYGYMKELK